MAHTTRWPSSTGWPPRDTGVSHGPDRQARRARVLQPLRCGLGARSRHALPVDQAGRLPLGRNAQRHRRPLAQGIKARGEVRSQFHHVIDVAPTVLEAAGLPQPESVNGIQQDPIEGVSMRYSFDDSRPPSGMRRNTSRSSAIAHLPQGLDRGDEAPDTLAADRHQDGGLR